MFLEWLNISLVHFLFCYLRVQGGSSFPPPLSREEEDDLFGKMKKGSEESREVLIERNLRLVAHIIKKYDTDRDDQEDLISIGTIGLIKAIDSFDPAMGTRFATYAGKCVQNEILMYFRSQKKLALEGSLQDAIEVDQDGNPLTVLDVLRVEDDIVEEIDRKSRIRLALRAVRDHLTPREKAVICMRYGLGKTKSLTQREVAKKMGISRSYVSRIEKAALEKLRLVMKRTRNYLS